MTVKRILSAVLAILFIFALGACIDKKDIPKGSEILPQTSEAPNPLPSESESVSPPAAATPEASATPEIIDVPVYAGKLSAATGKSSALPDSAFADEDAAATEDYSYEDGEFIFIKGPDYSHYAI